MIFASLAFKKSAPSSASAADEATNFKIAHRVCMGPFSVIGCPSIGSEPRNKFPQHDCVIWVQLSRMHQSVYLVSYLMRRNERWNLDVWPYNPKTGCIFLACFLLDGPAHLQYNSRRVV